MNMYLDFIYLFRTQAARGFGNVHKILYTLPSVVNGVAVDGLFCVTMPSTELTYQGPLLPTRINFNPNIDKYSYIQ